MQTPYPMLWFDDQAEQAVALYTSVVPDSAVTDVQRYPKGVPGGAAGQVMTIAFTLNGAPFVALNGGPQFRFTEAVSIVLPCDDQAEIDRVWEGLTAEGGAESQCGWLVDRFGLSWQVVPRTIGELVSTPAALQAMLGMKRLVIADLVAAAAAG